MTVAELCTLLGDVANQQGEVWVRVAISDGNVMDVVGRIEVDEHGDVVIVGEDEE